MSFSDINFSTSIPSDEPTTPSESEDRESSNSTLDNLSLMDILRGTYNRGHSLPSSNTWMQYADDFRRPNMPSNEGIGRRMTRRQQSTSSSGSSSVVRSSKATASVDHKETLHKTMARVWFERNAEKAFVHVKKEQSAQRIKDLRKNLDYIDETEWLYQPVDELIGQY